MANPEHFAKLKEGVEAWNQWRTVNPDIAPDLREADLSGITLYEANLSKANLIEACLTDANLNEASMNQARLGGANLEGARLFKTQLRKSDLTRAKLNGADLTEANLDSACLLEAELERSNLSWAHLNGADLSRAWLLGANLAGAKLRDAKLLKTVLLGAQLNSTDLRNADLRESDLTGGFLLGTNLERATLTGCHVFGISAWNVSTEGAIQSNLVITPSYEPAIQVDNLEVAQFVYLLLNNQRIRHVIDTITSKVVLILGRFTEERKAVLDAIRNELRKRDYLPILFDFEKPGSKDLTGTVTTLANMARFVIADLTDPSSVPHELATIAPGTVVPIQPVLLVGQREYAMFPDLRRRYHWVLEPYQYESDKSLMEHLNDGVIAPAEAKVIELRRS